MKKLGNKVAKILRVNRESMELRVRFEDGFTGTVSLEPIFQSPKGLVAEVLRGGLFEKCFVDSGALAWPNGLEFCPDTLRLWIHQQRKHSVS